MTNKIRLCMAFFMAFITSLCVQAQVTIGADKLPETFSVLQLEGKYSATQSGGLRMPQLTTAERDAMNIASLTGTEADKANGLMIYNTTINCIEFWNQGKQEWISLCEGGGGSSDLLSKPAIQVEGGCGLGITFRVHPAYPRDAVEAFHWRTDKTTTNPTTSVANAVVDSESMYIPYTSTSDVTYTVYLEVELKNGMSFEVSKSGTGRLNNDFAFKMVGTECYDTKQTDYETTLSTTKYGKWDKREQVTFGQAYTYEVITTKSSGSPAYEYEWTVEAPSACLPQLQLSNATSATATLSFNSSLSTDTYLTAQPEQEYLITLTCRVKALISGNCQPSYTLRKVVKIGDRDCCSSVTDADNNTYSAAMFGDAGCWMTQNLRVTKYADNSPITQNGNAGTNVALKYYTYPNNNATVYSTNPEYGLLYTWAAATNGGTTDSFGSGAGAVNSNLQGVCPEGWVLPSDKDWNELEKEITNHASEYSSVADGSWSSTLESTTGWRGSKHGRAMKSQTAVNGTASNGSSNASDANGFSALLVGYVYQGSPYNYGTGTCFWSSSENSGTAAWYRSLNSGSEQVGRGADNKYYFFSVRCKKNDN